jgi:hypothetical protein|tara:strand:- start:293 stop:892 length:600 start_codon:yes stop_codon:yes gene_type:complete
MKMSDAMTFQEYQSNAAPDLGSQIHIYARCQNNSVPRIYVAAADVKWPDDSTVLLTMLKNGDMRLAHSGLPWIPRSGLRQFKLSAPSRGYITLPTDVCRRDGKWIAQFFGTYYEQGLYIDLPPVDDWNWVPIGDAPMPKPKVPTMSRQDQSSISTSGEVIQVEFLQLRDCLRELNELLSAFPGAVASVSNNAVQISLEL